MVNIKCVLVGDHGVGKKYLLLTYATNNFPKNPKLAFYDRFTAQITVDGRPARLALVLTNGRDEYDRLRPLIYPETDVVVICFSVDSPSSYENVANKWHPEVTRHCPPEVPVLLVGTKSDLRCDRHVLERLSKHDQATVTREQGAAMAERIKACGYLECSALLQEGLKEVCDEAARAFFNHHPTTAKKNCVLS